MSRGEREVDGNPVRGRVGVGRLYVRTHSLAPTAPHCL
jgi:hypothetical protein